MKMQIGHAEPESAIQPPPRPAPRPKTAPTEAPRPKTAPAKARMQEATFEPAAPSSSRRRDDDDDRDDRETRSRRRRNEEQSSRTGLWIGLGVGGGVAALVLVGVIVWALTRSPRNAADQLAAAQVQADVLQALNAAKGGPDAAPQQPAAQPVANQPAVTPKPATPTPQPASVTPQPATPPPQPVAPPPGPVPTQMDGATIAKVKKATTFLRVTAGDGVKMQGSGFFAIEPGIVFTNAHVIDMLSPDSPKPRQIDVVLSSGEPDEKVLRGTVLGVDREQDLAVLKVDGNPGDWGAPLAVDDAGITELQDVFVFGFPFGSNLGKNITVTKSSISSLRKDETGQLARVQVNGGMNPGNSGGPVVDARGVVIGVSVSIIRGTQINFAVPSARVQQLLNGRVLTTQIQDPFKAGEEIRMPVELACLDPLNRIQKVEVEVWSGPPGLGRPSSQTPPTPAAGDGARTRTAATYNAGKAVAELALPAAAAGNVVWVQPVLTDARGKTSWSPAESVALAGMAPLERRPTSLRLDFAKVPERSLVLKNKIRLQIQKKDIISETLEVKTLERCKSVPEGGDAELWLGPLDRVLDIDGKQKHADPKVVNTLVRFPIGFTILPEGRVKGRRNLSPSSKLPPSVRIELDDMINLISNAFEATSISVPPADMQPKGTWQARAPLLMSGTTGRSEWVDMMLTCAYEGVRVQDSKNRAFVRVSGQVVGRKGKDSGLLRGKVDGRLHFDLESGYIADANVRIVSEIITLNDTIGALLFDMEMTRTPGNLFGIVPQKSNDPSPSMPKVASKLPVGARPTKILGGGFDPEYVDVAPEGGVLIGIEVGLGKFFKNDVVRAIRPIYRVGANESVGVQHGTQIERVVKLKAKAGYALAAVTIKAGATVDGMSATFMRVKNGKLDRTDSYESEWVGGVGGGAAMRIGGDGTLVVGVVGKSNERDATGLGLLLK
jgi:S1-C subfamily serine protease